MREDTQDIDSRLLQALEEAQREHAKASQTFEAIRADVPSSSPHTDRNHLVDQAARESRAALDAYRHAFQRYTNFTLRGIMPEDFER